MSEADADPGVRVMRWWQPLLLVAVLAGITVLLWRQAADDKPLPTGVTHEQYAAAERQFQEMYSVEPDRIDVLSLVAELAVADERLEAAVASFAEIPSDHPKYGLAARFQQAVALVQLNRADEAEEHLREFLRRGAANPAAVPAQHAVTAFKWLTYLLSVQMRLEERKVVLAEVHRYGLADVFDSKQYLFPNLLILNSPAGRKRLVEFLEQDPENLQLQVALGRYRTAEGRLEESQAFLAGLYQQYPGDLRVAAALLEACFEEDDQESFRKFAAELPEPQPGEPWLLTRMRGEFALQQERFKEAADHFQRALQEEPAYLPCYMGWASALGELSETDLRQAALRSVKLLAEIRVDLSNVKGDDPAPILDLVAKCEQIGFEEAATIFRWHAMAIRGGTHQSGSF
jgi:tetratricopeptide (TPR) repeat protein